MRNIVHWDFNENKSNTSLRVYEIDNQKIFFEMLPI